MPREPKIQPVKPQDTGDTELSNLARAQQALEQMTVDQRMRALRWLKARFQPEWPPEDY